MMEAASNDLGNTLRTQHPKTGVKFQLFAETLRGVAIMHKAGFVHRDLKPANVLVSGECRQGPCHAKVADLGLSCSHTSSISRCTGIGGTPLYMAPETLQFRSGAVNKYPEGVSTKNDVWALGLMFYEMVFGHLPAKIQNSGSMEALMKNIMTFPIEDDREYKGLEQNPPKPKLEDLRELFRNMLALRPKDRWSAAEALSKVESMAPIFGAELSENEVGSAELPDCWYGTESDSDFDGDGEDDDSEDTIVLPTRASPRKAEVSHQK